MAQRYMVTSGFLGAGKTTSMIAFSESMKRRGLGAPAVIANDLGADNIVDADFTVACDILTEKISGDCICYQHELLVEKLRELSEKGADTVFSDVPGCGIGSLDHVYIELKEKNPGEFELLPLTCIVDPERIRMLMPREADIHLPGEMRFLLDAQMAEADLIVLNKTDILLEEEVREKVRFIRMLYPETPCMAMSALTGEGVDEVVSYILSHRAPAVHREIGYGSDAFVAAEEKLCWYNRKVTLEVASGNEIDFNSVISSLFEEIEKGLKGRKLNVPHLKAFASCDDDKTDFFKASLIGVDHDIEYARKLRGRYSLLSVIINARAAASADEMSEVTEAAVDCISERYGLLSHTDFLEAFGMTEDRDAAKASRY